MAAVCLQAGWFQQNRVRLKVGQQVSISQAWSHTCSVPVDDPSARVTGHRFSVAHASTGYVCPFSWQMETIKQHVSASFSVCDDDFLFIYFLFFQEISILMHQDE